MRSRAHIAGATPVLNPVFKCAWMLSFCCYALNNRRENEAMTEWKPIETAPKDGAYIMLWDPGLREAIKGYYERGYLSTGKWRSDEITVECHPTHWMPLPRPPGEIA